VSAKAIRELQVAALEHDVHDNLRKLDDDVPVLRRQRSHTRLDARGDEEEFRPADLVFDPTTAC
jgi:hypothetical protein